MCAVWFLPESPRWLIVHDRQEEAAAIFAKYHCNGDIHHPLVSLQVQEVREQMKLHRVENPGWDFRELVDTRASRYRTLMVVCMAFFGQWSGNNVVTSFLPGMLKNAGIHSSSKQLLISAINPIFSLAGALFGASLLDKLGRRKMLFYGLFGAMVCYVALTALTAESSKNPHLVYGVIIFIYLFGISFAWGWTPLQVLYPVECLENRTRAKGAGLKYVFLNIASMTNTFGISVGISTLGWKLYLVFIGWQVVELLVVFFLFVETAGKTLEEMTDIFEAKNPVLKSLDRVTYDEDGNILDVVPATRYRL
jgi:MFS family permease